MRAAFAKALIELAAEDQRIVLLTADLGFMVLEPFASAFPERFYNVGVAEANMVGMATGLAQAGYIPFLYSIATFASMRAYEQFRNGPILHSFPVRLVGIGGGFEYGNSGITHYAFEDIGIMRLQPRLTTIVPADGEQTYSAIRSTHNLPGPIYFRIGKNDQRTVPGLGGRFRLGRIEVVSEGNDLLLIATGSISADVAEASSQLAKMGIHCTVAIVSSLRPEPVEDLTSLLKRFPLALTVETHYTTGGLGSFVAETIADHGLLCKIHRCGLTTMPSGVAGSENFLNTRYNLTPAAITQIACEQLDRLKT